METAGWPGKNTNDGSPVESCLCCDGRGCTTCPEDGNLFTCHIKIVIFQRTDKTDTVGIVPGQVSVIIDNGIAGANQPGCR